jgi:hypothetical protein
MASIATYILAVFTATWQKIGVSILSLEA